MDFNKKLQGEKYLVGDVLADSGFTIIYMGTDVSVNKDVIIREFNPKGSAIDSEKVETWKEEFLKEARKISKCKNLPGVISIKDFFLEDDTVYTVQEDLKGQSLENYLSSNGKITVNELLSAFKPIINSLKEVHMMDCIHRSICPENIVVLKDGSMKLHNFDAARGIAEDNRAGVLQHGYAPDEQYRARDKKGSWTDVYALCATMYKCVTGVTPPKPVERFNPDGLKMPSEMGISVDKSFEEALKKGLALSAGSRIQTMQELYDAFYNNTTAGKETSKNNVLQDVTSNVKSMVGDVTGGFSSILKSAEKNKKDKKKTEVTKTVSKSEEVSSVEEVSVSEETITTEVVIDKEKATETVKKSEKKEKVKKEKNTSTDDILNKIKEQKSLIIVAVIVLCVCLVGGDFVLKKTGKESKKDKETLATTENMESIETINEENEPVSELETSEDNNQMEVSEADMQRMEELKNASAQMEGVTEWTDILNEISGLLSTYGNNTEIVEASKMVFEEFYQNSIEYVNMIKGIEEFNADMYQECVLRLDELEKWNEALDLGFEERIANDKKLCKEECKNKFVDLFDIKCDDSFTANGVISRTVAWEVVKGLENTDLYNANSAGDSEYRYDLLRVRYITAKVLKIHKDIEGMYLDEAFEMIKSAMVECDYDPMLVYLLAINGYEPAQTWMAELTNIIAPYLDGAAYTDLVDYDRLNFVYVYNINSQDYRECKENVIKYMQACYE